MLKQHNRLMLRLFMATDLLLTYVSLGLAYFLRFHYPRIVEQFPVVHGVPPISDFFHLPGLLLIAVIWSSVFHFNGLYQPRRGKSLMDEVFLLLQSVVLSVILLLGLTFFYRGNEYSRGVVVLMVVTNIALLAGFRLFLRTALRFLRRKGFNQRQIVIAGAGDLGIALMERFRHHPELGYDVVGFLDDSPELQGGTIMGLPVLGTLDETKQVLHDTGYDFLYMALPLTEYEKMCKVMLQLQDELVNIKFVPDILQYITFRAGIEELDGLPVINMNQIPMDGWPLMAKRSFDMVVATAMLFVLSPLLLVLAALVKRSSPGPVLFRQDRLGLDGKTFTIYKFRTMNTSAAPERDWTTRNDPRVTAVGRFMRRWSLDELPQLYNVLNGTMSLVGPRPEQPRYVQEFRGQFPGYMQRHKVKSGITGWAQVHGLRGDTSVEKRIKFDLYYIDNWSLGLDVKILLLTLLRVKLNAH